MQCQVLLPCPRVSHINLGILSVGVLPPPTRAMSRVGGPGVAMVAAIPAFMRGGTLPAAWHEVDWYGCTSAGW